MSDVEVATINFESSDGTRLEADLLTPDTPVGNAVVCHPHPRYGGTRRDMVVAALSRGLVDAGLRVLRFDFRGAGGSAGTHGDGDGERDDLLAAADVVAGDDLPLLLAGYSFGADIALSVAHPAASGWLVAAPPLMVFGPEQFVAAADPRPVHIIVGAHDEIAAPGRVAAATTDWVSTSTTTVASADHFFAGAGARLAQIAAAAASEI